MPPLLLGIPGDNTYANYQEANSALWRQTILPLVERIALQLGNWLGGTVIPDAMQREAQRNGASQIRDLAPLRLVPDTDQLPALAAERDALWKRLEGASFLTTDEKRIAAGYGPESSPRNNLKVFDPSQPRDDHGRWIDAGDDAQAVAFRPRPPSGPKPPPPTAKPSTGEPQYKKPKSGQSGKEAASDIPSWAQGERPLVGEDGKSYAKRLLDKKYGEGKYPDGANTEFNRLRKHGDRHFED